MGWWDDIPSIARSVAWFSPRVTQVTLPAVNDWSTSVLASVYGTSNESVVELWRTQPHLRSVVAFRGRNIAQLGLHAYRRNSDGGRERDRSSVLAQLLEDVDGDLTTYDLLFALSGDLDLYDRAYLLLTNDVSARSGYALRRLPPAWVEEVREGAFSEVKKYKVLLANGKSLDLDPAKVIRFRGFDPSSMDGASPTIDTLRETLREQIESAKYRAQVWKRGGRVSAVLQRPEKARPWSKEQRDAFRADWYAKFTGSGSGAGGTPILEDGMTLQRVDFTARDQQFVEFTTLSKSTVAAAYFVQPAMLDGDGATFSSMRAFRKMLYTETLGPTLRQIEQRLNKGLVTALGLSPDEYYVEFNIEEKLRGDFEEQSASLSTATGGPWLTRNEARARQNLPALPGGDELITPLNVTQGGQASPHDSGSQNEVPAPEEESRPKAAPVRRGGRPPRRLELVQSEQIMKEG